MRLAAIAVAFLAVTPLAVADAAFTASELRVTGASAVDTASDALFLHTRDGASPFTFRITADEVVVEREVQRWVEATKPAGRYVYRQYMEPERETLTFAQATLESAGSEPGQAALVRALDAVQVALATSRGLAVRTSVDPVFEQDPADDVDGPAGRARLEIKETVPGEHLRLDAAEGTFDVLGDLTLLLVGPDYTLTAPEGAWDATTGERVTDDAGGLVRQGEMERQLVTLRGAVVHIDAPSGGSLLAAAPTITFTGTLDAEDPAGALPLPELVLAPDGGFAGRGVLTLTLEGGRIGAAAPAPLEAAGSARAADAPPVLAYAATALALAALLVLALVAARRRADKGDPVQMALLAMEDRRWGDALPHLDRALRAAPEDAKLLLDRAICLEQAGRLGDARDAYEAALRQQPFNAETHYYYARALSRLRNSTAAIAHLGRALSLDARLVELARREPTFAVFRDHPQFVRMLG